MEEKNLQMFFILKINAFEPVSRNSHNLEEDVCHWQSICHQATLRFNI